MLTTKTKTYLTVSLLFLCSLSYAQTKEQKEQIRSRYNQAKLSELKATFDNKAMANKQEALRIAAQRGWDILKTNADGSIDELMAVSSDGQPIYYTIYNVNAAKSTRANHLHSGGTLGLNVNGLGLTAHVWDGGPTRPTHQEFDGPGGPNRVTINDGVTTLNGNSFHAQHVTGTIVASGVQANAKGMAPQAFALTHDWNSDLSEATTEAANGMLISNHSYGFRASLIPDYYFGAYIEESRDWDNLMYNSPFYLMVVAAGNDGNDNSSNGSPLNGSSAFDKLNGHATSKNNMVVANGQDANVNTDGTLNSVLINSSSSEGPTDDLRIKPDITGNGTSVYSTFDNSDAAYSSITGTSMASPNVAGTLLLLQDHYNQVNGNFMRAATLKGLALHTADDAGISGPDAVYGWGLLNGKSAAEAISGNGSTSRIEELTLSSGQTYQITADSDGINALIASISWTDPAGTANTGIVNLSTPVLVNDLDIRVTKGASTFSPYLLTGVNSNTQGDNIVDPYERINVAGASGAYTITVTHKGGLASGSQDYTLIVTGITSTPVVCNAITPTGLNAINLGASSATLTWNAVAGASYDIRYREIGSTTWTNATDVAGNTLSLNGLVSSTSYEFQVRSKCPDATASGYSSSASFTTTAVSYCASNGNSVADEYISRVQLSDIDNTSGASGSGYNDFTSISTDLAKGSSYTITITPTWTGTVYNEAYSVWIDYNQDGDFSDSGEQVWTQLPTSASSVSDSFTVPSGALDGPTRMRVSMKWNGIPTSCESFSYGEVEDYTVNLGSGGGSTGCSAVTFSAVSSYGGSQDASGDFQVQDAGATLFLENNTWKSITLNYTVTANTYISFDFRSTSQGEIHGIGFDSDNSISSNLTFKVHGTQSWGISNYDNYIGSNWVSYDIPVGAFYTGSFDRLFFVNDNDAGIGNNSYFRNVTVHEGECVTTLAYTTLNNSESLAPVINNEGEYNFTVFPNPAQHTLNVLHNQGKADYSVLSISGKVILNGRIEEPGQVQISVDGLKEGIYFLKVNTESGYQITKFRKE
ncbi:MAG: S8 family serine peptidase [Bacteroidota bacterium]